MRCAAKSFLLLSVFLVVWAMAPGFSIGAEHGGTEHGGTAAPKKKKEHPGGKTHKGLHSASQGHKMSDCDKVQKKFRSHCVGHRDAHKACSLLKGKAVGRCLNQLKGHSFTSARIYSAQDIKTAMMKHIRAEEKKGIFHIDDKDKLLKLRFVKIHDPVRVIKGKGFFACTDFSVEGDGQGKLYDLDFWLNPQALNSQLSITKTRIHKHPTKKGGKWVKKARYTFINDEPVAL